MESSILKKTIQEKLIGTKWITAESDLDNKITIEIIDKNYCICSSFNKVKLRTYKISEDKIFIGDSISYVIKGNTFFQNNIPCYYKKE